MPGVKGRATPWLQARQVVARRKLMRARCVNLDSRNAAIADPTLPAPLGFIHQEFMGAGLRSLVARLDSFECTGY